MLRITDWTTPPSKWAETCRARVRGADLMRIRDAASILNVSPRFILNLIEEGRLNATNLNTGTDKNAYWQISKSDLLAYIDAVEKGI